MGQVTSTGKRKKGLITFGRAAGCLSLLGAAAACFLGGAAVMYFGAYSSGSLRSTFNSVAQWLWPDFSMVPSADLSSAEVTQDASGAAAAWNGYTLVVTTKGAEATLIDMKGRKVHHWKMTEIRPWPKAVHVRDPIPKEPIIWQRCHLFPNGDLLALCTNGPGSPYGYGLAKFDKESKLLWAYSANVHHDFDVAEDGRIYVLVDKGMVRAPAGLNAISGQCMTDYVVVLSPEGKELDSIPLLDAFRQSPFYLTLIPPKDSTPRNFLRPPDGLPTTPGSQKPDVDPEDGGKNPNDIVRPISPPDVLHTNSVRVLSPSLAPKFPRFRAGQILISMRNPSTLAVLDLATHSVVWATRGVWQYQHDAQFLDNGRILLFDNFGSPVGSRVLEYDPDTQAVPWTYGGNAKELFFTYFRGATQRLPNGNTLVVCSEACKVMEVTKDHKLVWDWSFRKPQRQPADVEGRRDGPSLIHAWRYGPEDLEFVRAGSTTGE